MTPGPLLDPIWKQAVLDLLDLDPRPGYIIDKAWLLEHFQLPEPRSGGLESYKRWQLRYLNCFDHFRDMLAEEFGLILTEKEGDGYRVLAPEEVADYSQRIARRDLRNAMRKRLARLKHTPLLDMTPEQREKHLSTLARAQWQQRLLRDSFAERLPESYAPPKLPKMLTEGQ